MLYLTKILKFEDICKCSMKCMKVATVTSVMFSFTSQSACFVKNVFIEKKNVKCFFVFAVCSLSHLKDIEQCKGIQFYISQI